MQTIAITVIMTIITILGIIVSFHVDTRVQSNGLDQVLVCADVKNRGKTQAYQIEAGVNTNPPSSIPG